MIAPNPPQTLVEIRLDNLLFFAQVIGSAQKMLSVIADGEIVGTEANANISMAINYMDKSLTDLTEMIAILRMHRDR